MPRNTVVEQDVFGGLFYFLSIEHQRLHSVIGQCEFDVLVFAVSKHLDKMLELLASTTAQVWLTGVDKSLIKITKAANLEPRVFHVKQGQATPA